MAASVTEELLGEFWSPSLAKNAGTNNITQRQPSIGVLRKK